MNPIRSLRSVVRPFALPLGLSLLTVLAVACDDDDLPPADAAVTAPDGGDARPADGGNSDVADGGLDASVDGAGDASDVGSDGGASGPIGVVVLSSDRTSTSIGLAALDGNVLAKDQCLHSGSRSPLLSAALSGDVVLPTDLQPGHEIVAIDRKNGTLTWVNGACEVLRQMNTGAGFASNPYDLIAGPGGKGYVPRYNLNPGNAAEGSDILIIDSAKATASGRIDLSAFTTATVPPAKPLLPFPTRGVLIGSKLYVALNHSAADYSAMGIGRVVVIDTATDTVVETIDLPGLKNCGVVSPVVAPNANAFAVGCSGPFSDGPAQIDSAGIAWVDVSASPAVVTVIPSKPFARPVSGFDLATIDRNFSATVVSGEFGMAPFDAVWTFAVGDAEPHKLYEADSSFSLSVGIDPWRRLLYILDAAKSEPLVHVFDVPEDNDTPIEVASYKSNPATGLPPRQVAFY